MSSPVPVTAQVIVEYKPWTVPNFASVVGAQDGSRVDELPQAALDALAQRWLHDLYAKANKTCPFKVIGFRSHDGRGPG